MIGKNSLIIVLSILFTAPFASAQDINLELEMPGSMFFPGMPCKLDLQIQNNGPDYNDVQLFVALTVGTGDYWFYPNWRHYPDDIDWMDISVPQFADSSMSIIPEFEWPEGVGAFSGAGFIAAVVEDGRLLSNMAQFDFSWSESPATPTSTRTPRPPQPTPTQPSMPTNFVYIPAGTFQMGSPPDEMCRDSDEGPVHTVTISQGFYILSMEVTQLQWRDIFGKVPFVYIGMYKPVTKVSWYDCCIYCNRLSQIKDLTPCYYSDPSYTMVFDGIPPVGHGPVFWKRDANGYRLPTEAEWEYACRAGTTTAYNSGEDNTDCEEDPNLDPLGRYYFNKGYSSKTGDVGSYEPNALGLYDMHGNAWEWCWDWYDESYYSSSPAIDPTGPSSGAFRVRRGGCFDNFAAHCRSATRNNRYPGYQYDNLGFRVVLQTSNTPDTQTPTPTVSPPTATPSTGPQTPTPTPPPGPAGFAYIPAGTFQMGSESPATCSHSDERPAHTVTISHEFFFQSTEVTQQQWIDVFGSNPSGYTGMNRPVEEVTWFDCCVYCNRLSQAEGLIPCYYSDTSFTTVFDGTPPIESGSVYWRQDANGYRLPTEAEWEYACRAGTTTAYNSGDDVTSCYDDPNLDPLGRYWYNGGSSYLHADVGSYLPNNWGLYDMHGNVWEWCWDWYDSIYYATSPTTDPTGPWFSSERVVRGGAYINIAMNCRSARRDSSHPGHRNHYIGFRVLIPID